MLNTIKDIITIIKPWFTGFWGVVTLMFSSLIICFILWSFEIPIAYSWFIYFLIGGWAYGIISPKISTPKIFIQKFFKYAFVYICVFLVVYVYAYNTILVQYLEWIENDRTLIGFLLATAPAIVLSYGAAYLTFKAANGEKVYKRILVICMVFMAFGVLFKGVINVSDKWTSVKVKNVEENIDIDRFKEMKRIGIFARVNNPNAKIFEFDERRQVFKPLLKDEKIAKYEEGHRYPRISKEEKNDGVYTLFKVMLPDDNGEYTKNAPDYWVRLCDVDLEKRDENDVKVTKISDKKFEVTFNKANKYFDVGQSIFSDGVWPAGVGITFNGFNYKDLIRVSSSGGEIFQPPNTRAYNKTDKMLLLKVKEVKKIILILS